MFVFISKGCKQKVRPPLDPSYFFLQEANIFLQTWIHRSGSYPQLTASATISLLASTTNRCQCNDGTGARYLGAAHQEQVNQHRVCGTLDLPGTR